MLVVMMLVMLVVVLGLVATWVLQVHRDSAALSLD
jgi:hypothetical protein